MAQVNLPETYSTEADVRAYAVGLVMQSIERSQMGAISPVAVIAKADLLVQYILNGRVEAKK